MADGASIDHINKRGTHAHTTSGAEVVQSITMPLAVDSIIRIEAWAHVRLSSSTKARAERRHAMGYVDAGAFTMSDEDAIGTALDVGASGYTIALVENGDAVELQVTAENGAFSHGYIQAWVTEKALSG